jgi:hypothetical protein
MATVTGLVLILVSTVVLVRRIRLFREHSIEEWPEIRASVTGPVLWMEPDFGKFLRGIGPSVAAAIFAGVGVAALAGGSPVNAGLMLAAAVAVAAWRWPMADRTGQKSGWSAEAILAAVLLIMTANWIAHPALETGMPRVPSVPSLGASNTRADLSGVILTLPIKSREKLLPSPSITRVGQVTMAVRPVRIEFDGVYWYFKAPDPRPRRDAKVVRGDPMRERIRSTNAIPIQMEAHQRLPEHTLMNRYQEIVVKMRDTDNLPGLIRVSLLLKGEKGMAYAAGNAGVGVQQNATWIWKPACCGGGATLPCLGNSTREGLDGVGGTSGTRASKSASGSACRRGGFPLEAMTELVPDVTVSAKTTWNHSQIIGYN